MGGLFVGLMLRQAGWDVEIFEKVEGELSGRGAGIVAQPELIATLRRLRDRAGRSRRAGRAARGSLIRAGTLIGARDCPQIMTAWERVFRVLRDAFPSDHYHRGKSLREFEDRDGAWSRISPTAAGRRRDLLIGADGLRSTVRQQCLPELATLYAGYVAWRALIPEDALSRQSHRDLFPYMAFCLPPGEQMLGYPVAGPDNDLRSGPSPLQHGLVPAGGRADRAGVAAHRRKRRGAFDLDPAAADPPGGDRRDARRRRAVCWRRNSWRSCELAAQPILQPIYDLETPRMAFGRVAIIGDAAFVARPHVGGRCRQGGGGRRRAGGGARRRRRCRGGSAQFRG